VGFSVSREVPKAFNEELRPHDPVSYPMIAIPFDVMMVLITGLPVEDHPWSPRACKMEDIMVQEAG